MRAMLSQPMAGKTEEEIREARERAISVLEAKGYEIVNTLFTDEWYSQESMKERGVVQIPLCFLAKSLENMSLCHAAFFCKGWERARGCRRARGCKAYGLEILYRGINGKAAHVGVGRLFHLFEEEVHMLKDTFRAQSEEIVVDMFAGAGGASCGLEMADIHVHAAINHDPVAVSLHARNHPETEHHVQDVYTLSPQWVTRGRRVGLLWMSPDCTHHSKAKGGAPTRNVRRRELAMVLVDRWIPELGDRAPRVVILENVEVFAEWGPLDSKGRIIEREGRFRTFVRKLRSCGYRVIGRNSGLAITAPTIRKRLFHESPRRDGQAIVWPEPTWCAGLAEVLARTRKPWRTAAGASAGPSRARRFSPRPRKSWRGMASGLCGLWRKTRSSA